MSPSRWSRRRAVSGSISTAPSILKPARRRFSPSRRSTRSASSSYWARLRARIPRCASSTSSSTTLASYHKAEVVKEWLAAAGRKIVLHLLPPYCPHLDPIERLWALMHENVTHNRDYKTFNEFRHQIR